jgi:2-hydroxy-3-keto-5-methylthiopentenyl-1-phosphate phosphatase
MERTMAQPPSPTAFPADLSSLLVVLDYDGTVTDREYNVLALQRLTGDAWRLLDEAVVRGELSHAECFTRQVGLIDASRDEIVAASLDGARSAPGFAEFLETLVGRGARVAVVSAGYREAIEELWRREGLPPVELAATTIVPRDGPDGPPWTLRFDPRFGDCPTCGPGGCKAGALRRLRRAGDAVAVFGDGVSDLCLAREADIVFARGILCELCDREAIAYHRLSDYRLALAQLTEWTTPPGATP